MNRTPSKWPLYICLFGLVVTILVDLGSIGGEHWAYFSIYGQRPVLVDQFLEFGRLYPEQPARNSAGSSSYSGPYSYNKRWEHPPAIIAGWKYVFYVAGIHEDSGVLIPPWGWGTPPTYKSDNGFISEFGENPTRMIPYRIYAIPLFYFALLFAALPAYRFLAFLRSAALRKPGTCEVCGYDLRASPTRCPECGTDLGHKSV